MDFEVNRQDFRDTRIVDTAPAELAQGQVRIGLSRTVGGAGRSLCRLCRLNVANAARDPVGVGSRF